LILSNSISSVMVLLELATLANPGWIWKSMSTIWQWHKISIGQRCRWRLQTCEKLQRKVKVYEFMSYVSLYLFDILYPYMEMICDVKPILSLVGEEWCRFKGNLATDFVPSNCSLVRYCLMNVSLKFLIGRGINNVILTSIHRYP
jgi:hypothetical protein